MEQEKSILYYISVGLIPIGLLFRTQNLPFGSIIFILGLFGIIIYFINGIRLDYKNNRIVKLNLILQVLIIIMSVVLFTKYLYYRIGDYPGLVIIPIYITTSLFYLIIRRSKDLKLIIISILYLFLTIPLFGFEFYKSPRRYIPIDWYDRFDVSDNKPIVITYNFEKMETEELNHKAWKLTRSKDYSNAIPIYRAAINIEPQNPILYFNLSECYAFTNDLENAISLLDTAIMLDNKNAPFFNNRGLLYYKLTQNDKAEKDFKSAISLDSMNNVYFANLALTFFFQNRYNEACKALNKAESLGFNSNDYMIEEIKKKCR